MEQELRCQYSRFPETLWQKEDLQERNLGWAIDYNVIYIHYDITKIMKMSYLNITRMAESLPDAPATLFDKFIPSLPKVTTDRFFPWESKC